MRIDYKEIANKKISDAIEIIKSKASTKPLGLLTYSKDIIPAGGLERGLYFHFTKKGQPLYIGKATSVRLHLRAIGHRLQPIFRDEPKGYEEIRKKFLKSYIAFLVFENGIFEKEYARVYALERIFIRKLQPETNKQFKKNNKYDSAIEADTVISKIKIV